MRTLHDKYRYTTVKQLYSDYKSLHTILPYIDKIVADLRFQDGIYAHVYIGTYALSDPWRIGAA